MNVLVIGGTLFLGRHLVDGALSRGWQVTLFNRGVTAPALYSEVEHVRGDRDGGLAPLAGRAFDAVFDTCGYVPRVVEQSARMLADATEHYSFVSTKSVYSEYVGGATESSPVHEPPPEGDEDVQTQYGPLKVGCERVLSEAFGDRVMLGRAGLIVGPHDRINRFPYWVRRLADGGTVLGPGDPAQPMQWIDARDLAAFHLDCAAEKRGGVFNLGGPAQPATIGDMLDATNAALGGRADIVWPGDAFLLEHGLQPFSDLPFWLPALHTDFLRADVSRAVAAGLRHRNIAESARDTLAAIERDGFSTDGKFGVQMQCGISRERERELLSKRP